MSPKQQGEVSLLGFKPTPEELAAAREVLARADDKKKRSAMQSMLQFVTNNSCPENDAIKRSRGQERQDYLVRYMAYRTNRPQKWSIRFAKSRRLRKQKQVHEPWLLLP